MKNLLSIVALFMVSAACIPSCVQDHAERIYLSLPPNPSEPEVLHAVPTRPFTVVADIQWMGGQQKQMVKRAKTLGGDAVIIQHLGGYVPLSSLTAEEANARSKMFIRASGTVIKYK